MAEPFATIAELTAKLTGTSAATTSAATARGTASLTAACDMVRLFTEQALSPVVTGGTVTLDGTGTDALLLPERPVLAAGTVIESGGTLTLDTDYKLGADGVLYRKPGLVDNGWGVQELRTYWWPGRQNIVVTYDHGYASDAVPNPLKEVALSMAARLFNQPNGNVVFESLGQRSIRYAGPATDWTGTEKIVLRKYKQAK